MKFCMIGCGGHSSDVHGPAQQACAHAFADLELSACCDRDEARAQTYREKFGYKRHYCDISEMIACEKPDALALVVPTHLTANIAEPLLATGIPLMLEKPPGLNRAEINRLSAAASRGRGIAMVAFNRRFMPVVANTHAMLNKTLPASSVLRMEYSMLRFARTDADFSTTAVHAFDAALYLARSPYRKAEFQYTEIPSQGPGVVAVSVNAEFTSGTQIHFMIQPVSGITAETIAVHGVDHSFFVDIQQRSYSHWHHGKAMANVHSDADPSIASFGFFEETATFIQAIKSGQTPSPGFSEVRQSVEMMEAMRQRTAKLEW